MAPRPAEANMDVNAGIMQAQAIDYSGGNVVLPRITRGVYIGSASTNLAVVFAGDSAAVTLVGLAPGIWHPMQIQQVNQTNSTATGVLVGY
jgi:hypothetical protein